MPVLVGRTSLCLSEPVAEVLRLLESQSLGHTADRQNLDVFFFCLTDEEMLRIKTLDTHHSQFYSHYDPERIEWLNGLRYDI